MKFRNSPGAVDSDGKYTETGKVGGFGELNRRLGTAGDTERVGQLEGRLDGG